MISKLLGIISLLLCVSISAAEDLWPLPPGAIARIGSRRLRHGDGIRYLAYSPEGDTLVSVDERGRVCFWDPACGELRRRLQIDVTHIYNHSRVWLSPASKTLAVGGYGCLRLYDVATGNVIPVTGAKELNADFVAVSHDGKTIATGMRDSFIQVIDSLSGRQIRLINPPLSNDPDRLCAALDQHGSMLFVGDYRAKTITVFDVASGSVSDTIKVVDGDATSIVVSPNGQTLAISIRNGRGNQNDHSVAIFSLAEGGKWHTLLSEIEEPSMSFSPDSRHLILCTRRHYFVFDSNRAKEVRSGEIDNTTSTIAPDGQSIAAGSYWGKIDLIDIASGKSKIATGDPAGQIWAMQFDQEGSKLAVQSENTVIWDWKTGRRIRELPSWGALSPDFSLWASCFGGCALLQQTGSRRLVRMFWVGAQNGWGLSFSADGHTLFTRQPELRAWDVSTGKMRYSLGLKPDQLASGAESADEMTGIIVDEGRSAKNADNAVTHFRFWNSNTGTPLKFPEIKIPELGGGLWLSSDGSTAAIDARRSVLAMGIGRDDPDLFTSRVRIWDLRTGRRAYELSEQNVSNDALALSPDGRMLAAGGRIMNVSGTRGEGYDFDKTKYEVWI